MLQYNQSKNTVRLYVKKPSHLGTIKKWDKIIIWKLPDAPLNPYHIISSFLGSEVLKKEWNKDMQSGEKLLFRAVWIRANDTLSIDTNL
jgi:hypothetical protein